MINKLKYLRKTGRQCNVNWVGHIADFDFLFELSNTYSAEPLTVAGR